MDAQNKVAIAAIVCLLTTAFECAHASTVSMLGEQDFSNGAIVPDDTTWLTAQSNETLPATGLYSRSGFLSYLHQGLDSGNPGILTLSLWNLDSNIAGNQITDFRLDNVPQSVSAFETGKSVNTVELFTFPVAASMLDYGQVQVLLTFGANGRNSIGIDFSRFEVVPEPTSTILGALPLALLSSRIRHRK